MTKPEITHKRDLLPSLFHRKLGRKILMLDIDCLEYQFKHGRIENVAIIDYKFPNIKNICADDLSNKVQINLANQLNIPFFIVITYLDTEEYSIPMFYVIAMNDIAKNMFASTKKTKFWLSAFGYCRFQHFLRGINIDLEREPELASLSKETAEYKLPTIS